MQAERGFAGTRLHGAKPLRRRRKLGGSPLQRAEGLAPKPGGTPGRARVGGHDSASREGSSPERAETRLGGSGESLEPDPEERARRCASPRRPRAGDCFRDWLPPSLSTVGARDAHNEPMTGTYSPRVRLFREEMIELLPRAPNNRASRETLRAMPTRLLILAFVTWRMRLIPVRPRRVTFWSGGVAPQQAYLARQSLRPFLQMVEAGTDLTPYLSTLVTTKGIVLPGASGGDLGKDIDMVLTREGLHHFHIGAASAANPRSRSRTLVFAEVLEREFRVVALADHGVFQAGSAGQLDFFAICRSYMAKDIPPGQAFMANPVMTSGHSVLVMHFADRCEDEIERLDQLLDDAAFIDRLYEGQPIVRDGQPVRRPANPVMQWHFEDLQFGILDRTTAVFFCLLPFFVR